MNTLSEREYWDSVRRTQAEQAARPPVPETLADAPATLARRLKDGLKRVLGKTVIERMTNYDRHLVWDVVLPKYVPKRPGARLLEVGSSPGHNLIRLWKMFDCVPYGVDYSQPGVEMNRQLFASHGLDPENVIHADFFSEDFHQKYKGSFDLIYSGGFVEHFTNVQEVIDRHVDLLAKDGLLIVGIPNVRGVNYLLTKLFDKDLLAIHNLDIMDGAKFRGLFDQERLSTRFCGYIGTFSFGLFATRQTSPKRHVLAFCNKLQLGINLFLRTVFKDKGRESRWLSPYLLYIGVKK